MAGFPRPGDEYGGRYEIVRELGHGGVGIVYEAVDRVLGRPVALKIVLPSLPEREAYQRRFALEASALAQIRSRHVVGIHEYGEHHDTAYVVTQLFPDGDLHRWLAAHGPLERRAALVLVAGVCEALADAHATGVVHGDVKPGNVLVWDRPDELVPYLSDFASTTATGQDLTPGGALAGTPAWMAPERHFGHPVDESGDVYAVGCVLWATLTGAPPYAGTDFQMMNGHINDPVPQRRTGDPVDDRLDALLLEVMAKDPALRPTADDVRRRLLDLVALADGPAPREPARTRSRPLLVATLALVVLAVVVGVGALLLG